MREPKSKPSLETIEHMISEIKENGVNLSAWEEEFMQSIYRTWGRYHDVSAKQAAIIEDIYSEKTP